MLHMRYVGLLVIGAIATSLAQVGREKCGFDLVIAVDKSCSLGFEDGSGNQPLFKDQLNKVQKVVDAIIDKLSIGPGKDDVRVKGFVTFHEDAVGTPIQDSTDKAKVKAKLRIGNAIDTNKCATNTAGALKEARKILEDNERRVKVLLILTDGKPFYRKENNDDWPNTQSMKDTKAQAKINTDARIATVTIQLPHKNPAKRKDLGLEDVFNILTLGDKTRQSSIADALDNQAESVNAVLNAIGTCPTPVEPEPNTNCKLDLVFALDRSQSIQIPDIRKSKNLMKAIVEKIRIGPQYSTVGVLSYNAEVKMHSDKACTDEKCALDDIEAIPDATDWVTRTDLAIGSCGEFIKKNSYRQDARQFCLVLTDGRTWIDKETKDSKPTIQKSKQLSSMSKPIYTEIVALPNYRLRTDEGEFDKVSSHVVFNYNHEKGLAMDKLDDPETVDNLASTIASSLCWGLQEKEKRK